MKNTVKTVFILAVLLIAGSTAFSIEISEYRHELTNNIRVKVEQGWNQTNATLDMTGTNASLSNRGVVLIDLRFIGDLVGPDQDISLYVSGRMKTPLLKLTNGKLSAELAKGKYTAVFRLPLQLNNGTVSFLVRDIPVKENTVSRVALAVNDIQVKIEETPSDNVKLSGYRFITYWAKGKNEGQGLTGYPGFFQNGSHDQMIIPAETESDTSGKVRPGTYDLNIDTDISNARYRYTCWLERVKLDAGKTYTFYINLNGSKVMTLLSNEQPKSLGFYPAGTAKKQGLRENKKTVLYSVQSPWSSTVCPTGIYDILLNYNYGERYEWKENVEFRYADITVIK